MTNLVFKMVGFRKLRNLMYAAWFAGFIAGRTTGYTANHPELIDERGRIKDLLIKELS